MGIGHRSAGAADDFLFCFCFHFADIRLAPRIQPVIVRRDRIPFPIDSLNAGHLAGHAKSQHRARRCAAFLQHLPHRMQYGSIQGVRILLDRAGRGMQQYRSLIGLRIADAGGVKQSGLCSLRSNINSDHIRCFLHIRSIILLCFQSLQITCFKPFA